MFECKDEESYHKMWNQIFGYAEREKFSEDQQKKVDWGKKQERTKPVKRFIKIFREPLCMKLPSLIILYIIG